MAKRFSGVVNIDVPKSVIDRIAQRGLTYTNFHTTALCSPTRPRLALLRD